MKVNVDVNFSLSVFDVIIFILFMWAAYKGFMRGALVQALSLFALLAGVFFTVFITKAVHRFLETRSSIPDLFSILFFGILCGFVIYGSHRVANLVAEHAASVPINTVSASLGVGFNIVKYLFIIGIYMLVLYKVDTYANFMPPREKNSKLARPCASFITTVFPSLKFGDAQYEKTIKVPDTNEGK